MFLQVFIDLCRIDTIDNSLESEGKGVLGDLRNDKDQTN